MHCVRVVLYDKANIYCFVFFFLFHFNQPYISAHPCNNSSSSSNNHSSKTLASTECTLILHLSTYAYITPTTSSCTQKQHIECPPMNMRYARTQPINTLNFSNTHTNNYMENNMPSTVYTMKTKYTVSFAYLP